VSLFVTTNSDLALTWPVLVNSTWPRETAMLFFQSILFPSRKGFDCSTLDIGGWSRQQQHFPSHILQAYSATKKARAVKEKTAEQSNVCFILF
jgi:hypothetical protein